MRSEMAANSAAEPVKTISNDIEARVRANVKGRYKDWNKGNPLPYRVWRNDD